MTQVEDFLQSMYGDIEGRVSVWWRPDPGSRSPYSKSAWFSWPEQANNMAAFIDSVADKDVCVTTASYSVERRIPENVEQSHAVWMDSDTCSGDHYRIEPSWTTVTSEGRWQHFWQLENPADAMRVSELVHRISIAHDHDGADQSSWPANKIMRVPGTMNTSHGFPVRVRATTTGNLYNLEDLEAAYADVTIPDRAIVRDIPDLHEDELPAYGNVLAKLPDELVKLATTEPKDGQDRSRLRYKMLLELFRAGLSFEEVLSVAWAAPASKKWSEEDPRGLGGLAAEAAKAAVEAGTPSAEPIDPYASSGDDEDELAIDKPVVLLTDGEYELISRDITFITKYIQYATKRLAHDNRAYDRLNAWMILSLAYMDTGYIPRGGYQKGVLNFFGMELGPTTSGKSSSFWLQKSVTRELFAQDGEFSLGGNASEVALVKALHNRDGKPSYFNSDEASGVLKVWVGQDWTSGMRERITELYDGEVTPLLRSAKAESITKTSRSLFNVFLAGTQRGIMDYLTADLFHSGFIPRFIMAIGQPRHTDFNSYAIRQGDAEESLGGFDPIGRQLAAELANNRKHIREYNATNEVPIMLTEGAAARLQAAAYDLDKEFRTHAMWDMIQPSILRWQYNVHKAACLLAMDRGEVVVSLKDMLNALQAGEEWFTNMLRIITRLNVNAFERACADIHGFVNSKGGKVGKTALFRRFKQYNNWEMDGFLRSLGNQHRVWLKDSRENGREYYYSDAWREE